MKEGRDPESDLFKQKKIKNQNNKNPKKTDWEKNKQGNPMPSWQLLEFISLHVLKLFLCCDFELFL